MGRLLLVDDDPDLILAQINQVFGGLQHRIDVARTGTEGIRRVAERAPDVVLLDSSYGSLEWFADWCRASPDHRLVSLFTDHLADENKEIMGLLDKAGVKYRTLEETKLSDDELEPRGPVFMHTKGPHDQVPVDYFGKFVGTSALLSSKPHG